MNPSLAVTVAVANLCLGVVVGLAIGLASRRGRAPAATSGAEHPPAGDLLDELRGDLEQAGHDLEDASQDLRDAADDPDRLHARLGRLNRWSRFLARKLERGSARLADAPPPADGWGTLLTRLPLLRAAADELGELSDGAPETVDIVAVLAAAGRLAAENRRLRRELDDVKERLAASESRLTTAERDARIDALTRLPNRRSFTERLAAFQSALERGREPYAVVLFDLDGFKGLNDRHGHAAGDAVLGVFAAVLRDSVRPFDHPARWGGEEFAVILPGADAAGATAAADRVRRAAAAARVLHDGREIRFTVSGGAAAARPDRDVEATIAAADAALYAAKSAGRNRVQAESERPVSVPA